MHKLQQLFQSGPVLFDGAMGTMQTALGLPQDDCPEALNLACPEDIYRIHRAFAEAGCQVLCANTFGANAVKMAACGHEADLEHLVTQGVRLARRAAQEDQLVALSLGPTGDFLAPYGALTPDTLAEAFTRPLRAGQAAGADFAMLETQCDLAEARAALLAANALSFPAVVSFTFEPGGRTLMGNPPEACATLAEALGAMALGINCSCGPEELLPVVRAMRAATSLPVIVQPNAGMPELREGATTYPYTPQLMASKMQAFLELGLDGLGGCCGSTPEHLRRIADLVPRLHPQHPTLPQRVCSRRAVLSLQDALADFDEARLPDGASVEEGIDEMLLADTGKAALLLDAGSWTPEDLAALLQEGGDLDPRPLLFRVQHTAQAQALIAAYAGVTAVTGLAPSGTALLATYGAIAF